MDLTTETVAVAETFSAWQTTLRNPLVADGIASYILLVALIIVRVVLGRFILRKELLPLNVRRRWLVMLRNVVWIVLCAGLAFIWAHQAILRRYLASGLPPARPPA